MPLVVYGENFQTPRDGSVFFEKYGPSTTVCNPKLAKWSKATGPAVLHHVRLLNSFKNKERVQKCRYSICHTLEVEIIRSCNGYLILKYSEEFGKTLMGTYFLT